MMSSQSSKFNSRNVLREVNLEIFRPRNFPAIRYKQGTGCSNRLYMYLQTEPHKHTTRLQNLPSRF